MNHQHFPAKPNLLPFSGVYSASSALSSTVSTTYVDVDNLSVSFTASGNRPVMIMLVPDSTQTASLKTTRASGGGAIATFMFTRAGTDIGGHRLASNEQNGGSGDVTAPVSSLVYIDNPTAGTYTYKLRYKSNNASTSVGVYYAKLLVYEL